jgi:prolyl-tRNA editing enzyme YbaK/EbsC (Cys-tRNA(Pro) deacylase)
VVAVREMAQSTRSAEDAAAACGVTVGQIVKSLVFLGAGSKRPYLLLVSGKNRVNETAVAAHLGEGLKRPDATFVRDLTGFAIGGIPPFGHDRRLTTYLDADLLTYDVVWAAAGTPRAVFPVTPALLRDAIGAKVIAMT